MQEILSRIIIYWHALTQFGPKHGIPTSKIASALAPDFHEYKTGRDLTFFVAMYEFR